MSNKASKPSKMLEFFLHETHTIGEQYLANQTSADKAYDKDQKDVTGGAGSRTDAKTSRAVNALDRTMDRQTDAGILREAREWQKVGCCCRYLFRGALLMHVCCSC